MLNRKRCFVAGILGGITVYLWGSLSWMVLPWHMSSFYNLKDDVQVASVVKENITESGIYLLPNFPKPDAASADTRKAAQEMYERRKMDGPSGFLVIQTRGNTAMVNPMLRLLAIEIIAGLIVAWLLSQTQGLGVMKKAMFTSGIGLVGGMLCLLPESNFWGFPLCYTLVGIADLVIGWFFGGLVIAKISGK